MVPSAVSIRKAWKSKNQRLKEAEEKPYHANAQPGISQNVEQGYTWNFPAVSASSGSDSNLEKIWKLETCKE